MSQSTLTKLQDAALDVANLALVVDVPARQWQATVERYRAAKTAHNERIEVLRAKLHSNRTSEGK